MHENSLNSKISDESIEDDPFLGVVFADKYHLLKVLGSGGWGSVYQARHTLMDKIFAVKLLHPGTSAQSEVRQRFQREAQSASSLTHPNIITVHDFGMVGQIPYMVMDYIKGETLADILEKERRWSVEEAMPLFLQCCDALIHAHERGVVHRDLKPSNLMIEDGPDGKMLCKLVDFGLSKPSFKESEQKLTVTGALYGTPLYMSPEQCRGAAVDTRSDIYSLGVLMYETLIGDPPFVGRDVFETIDKQMTAAPENFDLIRARTAHVRQQMELIIRKAMSKEPAARYQNVSDLKKDLLRMQGGAQAAGISLSRSRLSDRGNTMFSLLWMRLSSQLSSTYSQKGIFAFHITAALLVVLLGIVLVWLLPPNAESSQMKWADVHAENPPPDNFATRDALMKKALTAAEKKGPYSQELAVKLGEAGLFYRFFSDNIDEAEKFFSRAIAIQLHNDPTGASAAPIQFQLAECFFTQKKFAEAMRLYQACIENFKKNQGSTFLQIAPALVHMAEIYKSQQHFDDAINAYKEALSIWQMNNLSLSAEATLSLSKLASLYMKTEQFKLAEQALQEAAKQWRSMGPAQDKNLAVCMVRLAEVNQRLYGASAPDPLYTEALAILERHPELKKDRDLVESLFEKYLWEKGNYPGYIRTRLRAHLGH